MFKSIKNFLKKNPKGGLVLEANEAVEKDKQTTIEEQASRSGKEPVLPIFVDEFIKDTEGTDLKKVLAETFVETVAEEKKEYNGFETNKWYVDNSAGSNALLFLYDIYKKYGKVFGFNESGEWVSQSTTYDLDVVNFIEADPSYVEQRVNDYSDSLQRKAQYQALSSDQTYTVGQWYGGVNGRKRFLVLRDYLDLTYLVSYIDKNNCIVESVVTFDERSKELTIEQVFSFLKNKAVNRGFRRKDLKFKDGYLYAGQYLIWSLGQWNLNVLSATEAGKMIGCSVI